MPARLTAGCAVVLISLLPVIAPQAREADQPLVDAARARDWSTVERLLAEGAPVDAASADGTTALHWAVHRDEPAMAEALLGAGADPNVTNELGVTPLRLACVNGSAAMVARLLAHGADPSQPLATGVTPLMSCARSGDPESVRHLLEQRVDVNTHETVRGQTALMWAVAEGHLDVVGALLAAGAEAAARSTGGFTPLLFAAQQGDQPTARRLVEAGVDIDAPGGDGSAALLVATESGHLDMVRYLIDAGADVDAIEAGRTALHAAVQHERPDMVTLLLDHGADPDARLGARLPKFAGDLTSTAGPGGMVGATPFWLAAKFADLELMRLFADRGADTRAAADDGTTPLMVAAGIGFLEGYDRYGRLLFNDNTASRQRHDLDVVRLAFDLGGDVGVVNEHGQTVMHGAAYAGNDAVVRFLSERGAAPDVADRTGLTPLAITEGMWVSGTFLVRETTAELLRELGAGQGGQP